MTLFWIYSLYDLKPMKKILLILIAYHLSLITSTGQSLSDKYNNKRPVVMVCDWDKPPYEFLNDKGEPAGSNIDVMRAVMKEIGIPITFVMKEWSTALKTFERGDADIILANTRRYNRDPYVLSGNIVNYNRIRVATHSDSTGTISFKQLEREGAVFKPGDYSAFYFMDGDSVNTSFMEFQSPKVALLGLLNGDYKYYVWGEEPLKWKIKELNLEGIVLNDVGIPISELHVVGRDRKLIEQIDDHYSRLKQRGDIASIQDRWFHPERIDESSAPYWLYIASGILLLIVIMYFFIWLARRHVISATRAHSELNDMMGQALHMGNFIVMEYDIKKDRMTNSYGSVLPSDGLTLEEFTARIHADQRQEFVVKTRSLLEGRERHFELDKRWNAGDVDDPHWLNFHGHAICELDSEGRPAYIVNAIHDFTQEVEGDEAVRNLLHKYEVLGNIPFVAMSFYDKDGYLYSINDAMKDLCAMDRDSDAQHFWENVSMFDVPLFRGMYSPGSRDSLCFCQHFEYPEFGLDKYIEVSIHPLFNSSGDLSNYLCTAFDVTRERTLYREGIELRRERERILQEVSRERDRMNYLLVNSDRFLLVSSIRDERISFFRTPDAPVYRHNFLHFQRMLAKDDGDAMMNILYDDKTRTPQSITIHIAHPFDGQAGTVYHIVLTPVIDAQGEIVGHEGIATDVTRINELSSELSRVSLLAEESLRLKSAFMASMTHELRTPLNAIIGFTSIIESLEESPERSEYVRIIHNGADMLQRLINDIIEASSITYGAFTIEPKPTDFAVAFVDICVTLAQRVQNPNVEFQRVNLYAHYPTIIDIGRIQQVLTNFVTNAVKFTTQGYIRLGWAPEQRETVNSQSGAKEVADGLYLYCEDTGQGIPLDKQSSVFERFVKLDEFVQGTGMGLAICKSIAERCGGSIGVISAGLGRGCTFWLWVPCEKLPS